MPRYWRPSVVRSIPPVRRWATLVIPSVAGDGDGDGGGGEAEGDEEGVLRC